MSQAATLFSPPLEGGAGEGVERQVPAIVGHRQPAPSPPVVLAAGGTGGHFFPAEALAQALLDRGRPVVLLTDARSGGGGSPVFAGHPVHVLRGSGVAGHGLRGAARGVVAMAAGAMQARAVLAAIQPAAIVAFGGYPSVGPVFGARLLRRRPKVILHEQNAVLGRANRRLARGADLLALSFAATARVPAATPTVLTGNPVRPAIAALAGSAYHPPRDAAPLHLLVLGGSLGARVLSQVVPAALAALPQALRERLRVTQQCRAEDLAAVQAAYATAGIAAALAPFFAEVAPLLASAQLVIARAGASTVAELAVVGRPAVLVPLPGAIDDHQSANAAALGNAAWVLPQAHFTAAALAPLLHRLITTPDLLAAAAAHMAGHGRAAAATALADLVEQVIAP